MSITRTTSSKVLVVCHDAGGAEVVSSYIGHHRQRAGYDCRLAGPAVKIFKRKGIEFRRLPAGADCHQLINSVKPKMVITGTSWGSAIEIEAIRAGKESGIKTVAVLDHWVNYRERFGYPKKGWKKNLPDEIWIADKQAFSLAKKVFSKIPIKLIPNYYLIDAASECTRLRMGNKRKNLLFLSEPVSSDKNAFGARSNFDFDEFVALADIMTALSETGKDRVLAIRFHPSESRNKYDHLIKKAGSGIKVVKSNNKKIVDDLARARAAVGMESMALMVAAACGAKTLSYFPNSRKKCILPSGDIEKIESRKELSRILNKIFS